MYLEQIIEQGIHKIFKECQENLDIKNGDVSPEEHSTIEECKFQILRIVINQRQREQKWM